MLVEKLCIPGQITPSQHNSHFGKGVSEEEKERRGLWVRIRVLYPDRDVGNTGRDVQEMQAMLPEQGLCHGCHGNRCKPVLSPRDDVIAGFRGWV